MKLFKSILIVLLAAFAVACDEVYAPEFDASKYAFVAFVGTEYSVEEDADTLLIPVSVAAGKGEDVQVTFSVKAGTTNGAVLGTDYKILNANNTVVVEDGVGIGYIAVATIGNDVYDKNKTFSITLTGNSADYFTSEDAGTVVVTISDNEHPLGALFGNYVVSDYMYADGSLDEYSPYAAKISSVEGSETSVSIMNFWGGNFQIFAEVDLLTKTIAIHPGSVIYEGGVVAVAFEGGISDPTADLVGTFDDDGIITIGAWTARVGNVSHGEYRYSVMTKQ